MSALARFEVGLINLQVERCRSAAVFIHRMQHRWIRVQSPICKLGFIQ